MRGKGGEIFFDRLRVADIAEHAGEHGDLAPPRRGNKDTARRHQAEQPAHFQRDRLAARVGAGNEQYAVISAQRDGYGDRRFRVEQRVAPLLNVDGAAAGQAGSHAFGFIGVLRLGKGAIDFDEARNIFRQLPAHRADAAGKLRQDALDLLLLRRGKFAQFVVHLQNVLRLDKEGGAARRTVMHKATDFCFVLRADGQNIAVVAHGDDAVLQIFCTLAVQVLGELGADPLVQQADVAADVVQLVARVVTHLIVGENFFRNVVFQRLVEIDARGDVFEPRTDLLGQRGYPAVRNARRTQKRAHREQFAAGEGCPLLRPLHLVLAGCKLLDAPHAVAEERSVRLRRQIEQFFRFRRLHLRDFGEQFSLRLFKHGETCNARQNFIQFEFFQNFIHFLSLKIMNYLH